MRILVESVGPALERVGDAVIGTNREGRVLFLNDRAELLTGWPNAEALGRRVEDVFQAIDEQTRRPARTSPGASPGEAVSGGGGQAILRARDGAEHAVLYGVTPVRGFSGATMGSLVVFRSVDPLRHAGDTEAMLAAIVDSSEDAIVSKTLDGIVRSWNAGAQRLFGYTPEEAIGRSITLIIPGERQHEEAEILARLSRGERIEPFETVRLTKGGRRIDISLTVSPVRDARGRIIGASKIARDISREKAMFAAADEARRRAELADRRKDEFVAMVAHEMRGPLSAMTQWMDMIEKGLLVGEEPLRRAHAGIGRGLKAQARIVEDLFDLARIQAGKLELRRKMVDPLRITRDVIDGLGPLAVAKQVELDLSTDGPALLLADPVRFQQVLWNLVSNAVKFTPKGGRVDVWLGREGPWQVVRVSDTGVGIPSDLLPCVFEPFRQGDATTEHQGLGLGLAVTRRLVELHGGTLQVESPGEGLGATFTVTYPVPPLVAEPGEGRPELEDDRTLGVVAPSGEPSARLAERRVLVVDDDADVRELLHVVLTLYGAQVQCASSVAQAVEQIGRRLPDVIVCDIGMPEADGFDFMERLEGLTAGRGERIPVIALTAYGSDEDCRRVLAAGFRIYLTKPVEVDRLVDAIAQVRSPAWA